MRVIRHPHALTVPLDTRLFSVAVLSLLERSLHLDVDVVGLFWAKWGELGAESGQVEGGDLLVKLLGQEVDLSILVLVVVAVLPELDLSEDLVGEGAGHDE